MQRMRKVTSALRIAGIFCASLLYFSCPLLAPPSAPAALSAISLSEDKISISWVDTSLFEKGFLVERSDDSTTFQQIAAPSANTSDYMDSGLSPNTEYLYRVCAYNTYGLSDYSEVVTCSTQTSDTVPTIAVSPDSISTTTEATNADTRTFTVTNTGGGILAYSITDNASWLSCSPSDGTSSGESDVITIDYLTSGLTSGTHSALISVSDSSATNSPQTIEVSLVVPSADESPEIDLSTTSLSPVSVAGTNAASQSFTVQNSGGGTLSYSISEDKDWLACSPATGTSAGVPNTIAVTYATSTLDPGTYSAIITVTSDNATNDPQQIGVSLTVTPAEPRIALSTTSLTASATEGINASSQTFTVRNMGTGTLDYEIDVDATWLSCEPTSGNSTGELDTIVVTYTTSDLAAASYVGKISVRSSSADNSPQVVTVNLTVVPLPEPVIELTPSSLSQSVAEGSTAASQSFTIRNSGTGTLSYQISDTVSWLSCTPTLGTSSGEPDTITITYNTSTLSADTYTASIIVEDGYVFVTPGGSEAPSLNSPQSLPVTLNVLGPPAIESVYSITITEVVGGNGDGDANVGEDVYFRFRFANTGGATAYNVVSRLYMSSSDSSYGYIYGDTNEFSTLDPGGSKRTEYAVAVTGVPSDGTLDFTCEITWEDAAGNTYLNAFGPNDGLRIQVYQ